eukprot:TRINITY_DN1521_c0_g1_i4.p2 TRINITY_DN1521_c0_g1~~TRINITY_DN1521_c0_g1_i4.p2  ORF type:complete len:143 (+),score=2.63 TRINITY_DN1521_c0_g1_i4:2341-2769(+)
MKQRQKKKTHLETLKSYYQLFTQLRIQSQNLNLSSQLGLKEVCNIIGSNTTILLLRSSTKSNVSANIQPVKIKITSRKLLERHKKAKTQHSTYKIIIKMVKTCDKREEKNYKVEQMVQYLTFTTCICKKGQQGYTYNKNRHL